MPIALFFILLFAFTTYGQQNEELSSEERKRIREERLNGHMRPIKPGFRITAGSSTTYEGSSSQWFDVYQGYDNMGEAQKVGAGGLFAIGLTLNIWPSDLVALITELNYNFFSSNYCYGEGYCVDNKDPNIENIIWATIYNNTISIPVLLRLGPRFDGVYFEAGYQWSFPFYSSMWVRKGNKFPYEEYDDRINFSKYRRKIDHAIVLGIGGQSWYGFGGGLRFFIPLTKLDKAGTLNSPFTFGLLLGIDFQLFFEK